MAAPNTMGVPAAAPAPGAPAPQAQGGFVQPVQAAQPSPLAQTFTAWFRGPGLTSTALSLAIVLGSAAISAILTMVAMSTTDSTKTFPTTFSTLPLLMGWSLGGQFVMSGSNEYETITLTFTLLPMGALTAAGIGVFWLARRRAAVDGSAAPLVPTLARAGAEALAVALVACLVTAPFSMTAKMMGLKVMTVSSSALMTILLVTVVVFVALMVARSGGALLERLPSPVVQIGRELGALSTALGVVLGIFIIVAYIAAVLIQGSGFASILLLPVLLPNLVLLALGMGSLGGITLDKSEAAAALAYFLPSLGGKDGGDAYAWTWFGSWSILLFAAMIVAIVAAALRVGVRRARTGRTEWRRVWQLPLVSLALGAIVFYGLLPLRFSGADTPMRSSGGGSGHYMSLSMQPNALTFLMVGIVAAIISVLAELLPLWVYSSFPAVLQLAGGKKASAAWRAGTSGVSPTSSSQQWAYSTDPATGASIATDPATGAVFSMDPATGQWVETTPASQAPAPGFGGAAAGAPASGQLPEPAPMSAASRKKVILGLSAFGVVVALVVAGVVALNIVNGMRGPDKAVESYLTLLSEGKAAEATKMVDPGVPNDQRKLLTDDALKAAKARIKVTKIDKPTISGDTATIKAHLSLDGKAFEYNFTASKTSGSFGLDSWKVDKPLVVSADFSSSSLPGLKVAGVAIDMAKDKDGLSGYRSTQVVYPGVYPVAAPDSVSKYLTAKETSFTLIPSGEGVSAEAESVGTQTVDATPTDELKTKALEKVKEQTKTCATVPTNSDKTCPFQTSSDMTSLSVEKDATKVEFSKDSNDLSFTSDEISISGSPKPTAFDKNPSPRKAKFTFSGKVELPEGGGEPTITIESSSSVF
ncbi:hypothetical protein BKH20_01250 [Actinomyces oris]|uniref:Uncharacterized protein n=1 Tax=Actinomyces oris TaxID=544580 RepID=A0A1Q8WY06_9ACTO|nr:hypothetical protein [Actinomyces oris]OLO72889.1 hypothetical protein BKH20_01250 [Actinomyces oris]